MSLGSAALADTANDDVRDISGHALARIEELIADGAIGDALNALQDMVRDFAHEEMRAVLALRAKYAAVQNSNDRSLVVGQREEILDLAYRVDEKLQRGGGAASPADAAKKPVALGGDMPVETVRAPQGSAPASEDVRQRHFELIWKDPKSIVIDAQELVKSYKRSGYVMKPISFQLRLGEITGIVGRNASGKTTLLRMLMGEIQPDGGKVAYPGLSPRPGDWKEIRRRIAYVPQLPEKWFGTLRQNLNFFAAVAARNGQDPIELIEQCLTRYELKQYENATWDEISGGYKTRFELVRALVTEPSLLVLDEPLAYLDVIARQRFLLDLKTIATSFLKPMPVVVTSQHLNEIEAVADQIVFIDNGDPRYIGPLAGIAEMAEHRTFEVSLRAARDDMMLALSGLPLQSAQPTMEGYLLAFPKSTDIAVVFQRLRAAFGDRLIGIRDVTASVRSLMTESIQ
jgi:ABC-type multidrug transport system ATPase subunit